MEKKTVLINLKHATLCAVLPLLMVACNNKGNSNVDKELAETDAQLAVLDQKLSVMQQQTDSLVTDSLPRDKKSIKLSKDIAQHKQRRSKFKAPKDSVSIKWFNRKIGSLTMDSMMNADKVKRHFVDSRMDEFRAIYKQQDILRARRDSLMKIKSR